MDFVELLEGLRFDALTTFNLAITWFGSTFFILSIIFLVYWCFNNEFAFKIGFAFIISGFFIHFINLICRIDRPFTKNTNLTYVNNYISAPYGYSFPSIYVHTSTTLFTSLFLEKKNIFTRTGFIIMMLLVPLSRMYLGLCSPLDTLVSLVLTIVITTIIYHIMTTFSLYHHHRKYIALAISILPTLLISYSLFQITNGLGSVNDFRYSFIFSGITYGFVWGWYLERTYINFNETAAAPGMQIAKFVLGAGIALGIYKVLTILLITYASENTFLVYLLPYFLSVFWAIGFYPLIIKKFLTSQYAFRLK